MRARTTLRRTTRRTRRTRRRALAALDGKAWSDVTAGDFLKAAEKARKESSGTGGNDAPALSGEMIE